MNREKGFSKRANKLIMKPKVPRTSGLLKAAATPKSRKRRKSMRKPPKAQSSQKRLAVPRKSIIPEELNESDEPELKEEVKNLMEKIFNKRRQGVDMKFKCILCKKPTLMKCSGCNSVYYCGHDHQKLDWHAHKRNCLDKKAFFGGDTTGKSF